jgi:hypothetical protein
MAKGCELIELFEKAWGKHLLPGCAAMRAMFELDLLVRLFEQEPDSRIKFYHSLLWEEIQEVKAFLSWDPPPNLDQPLNKRLEQLQEMQKRYELDNKTDIVKLRWGKLAERFGVSKDYDAIYRRTSRLLHITPSSLLQPETLRKAALGAEWNILLVRIQMYFDDLLQRLAELLEVTREELVQHFRSGGR